MLMGDYQTRASAHVTATFLDSETCMIGRNGPMRTSLRSCRKTTSDKFYDFALQSNLPTREA